MTASSVTLSSVIPSSAAASIQASSVPVTNYSIHYYRSDWSAIYFHYNNGGGWTVSPGAAMGEKDARNWAALSLPLTTNLVFCFNNGSGAWDNNGGNNYRIGSNTPCVWVSNGTILTVNPFGPTPPSISASPAGGYFTNTSISVTLSLVGSNILAARYSIDGSDPAVSGNGFVNGAVLQIGSDLAMGGKKTLKLFAANDAGNSSVSYDFIKTNALPKAKFTWDNATVYFVIQDRFYNGNTGNDNSYGRVKVDALGKDIGTFHGGDLKGLTTKLNEGYFSQLGVNVMWITAPYEQVHGWCQGGSSGDFAHYAYHGYYVLDYTAVDANMGTAAELKEFIDTAHEKGIRVVFDIVMNHTGYVDIADMKQYGYGAFKRSVGQFWTPGSGESYANINSDIVDYNNDATAWGKWWGSDWLRCGITGYASGSGDIQGNMSGLPDFRTELEGGNVALPPLMVTKWTAEGRLAQEQAKLDAYFSASGKARRPRYYMVKWLSDWVRDYGVDGFRCDTAKHIEMDAWGDLKDACVQGLKDWKASNTTMKLDDLDFWMVGECNPHGLNRDSYYSTGKFDSMINFDFVGAAANAAGGNYPSMENTYNTYANAFNTTTGYNVLSYISSHDTSLFYNNDDARQKRVGAILLLSPGGVQIFYGDENCRTTGNSGSESPPTQGTRTDYAWGAKPDVLSHWQKIGVFRRDHPAVGAGLHNKLSDSPYTFSRVYTRNGADDRVVCAMGVSGTVQVSTGSVWPDGTAVRDAYSGNTGTVSGGKVTIVSTGDVVLLEAQ